MSRKRRTSETPSRVMAAAAVLRAANKLFDRQDGEGVEKRLLASILFTGGFFDVLDRITDEDRGFQPDTRSRDRMPGRRPVPVCTRPDLARPGVELVKVAGIYI